MKLFRKRQIAGAVQVKDLFEKMMFPSTADFTEIVRASIPGCDVTPADAKAAEVIWGRLVLKMKGNTVRRNAKHLFQSVIKVPKELIKHQQDAELAIDCFCRQTCLPYHLQYQNMLHNGDTRCLRSQRVYVGSSPCDLQDVPPQGLP